jgi:hypothetical protein
MSPRFSSFWFNSNLKLTELVELAYLWAHRIAETTIEDMTGHSSATVVQWLSYFHDVCSWHLVQNPRQIVGPGIEVQVLLMYLKLNNRIIRILQ